MEIKAGISTEIMINQNKGKISAFYSILDNLGQGSYGDVYKVKDKATGDIRVMKTIKKEIIGGSKEEIKFLEEIAVLKKLQNPFILKLFEFFEDVHNIYLIMEYIEGKTLMEFIISDEEVPENLYSLVWTSLLTAVNFLHSSGVVHRDIKPENIMITQENGEYGLKLIDFGTSHFFKSDEKMHSMEGTPFYIAPEVIEGNYTNKCDIWSIGVVSYALITGCLPFDGEEQEEILQAVKEEEPEYLPEEWEDFPPCYLEFVKALLERDLSKRPSAAEALKMEAVDFEFAFDSNRVKPKMQLLTVKNSLFNWVSQYMVHFHANQKEDRDLIAMFNHFDADKSGKVDRDELKKALEAAYGNVFTDLKLQEIFETIDSDYSGEITVTEFLRLKSQAREMENKAYLKKAFDKLDLNGDGKLDVEELWKNGVADEDESTGIVSKIDADNDGEINFKEFCAFIDEIIQKK